MAMESLGNRAKANLRWSTPRGAILSPRCLAPGANVPLISGQRPDGRFEVRLIERWYVK